jgi:hypothetical protein
VTGVHVIALVGALVTLAVIIELLRRRQLREKYAVLWLAVGLVVAVLAVFPRLLTVVADGLGVAVPLNLLLFVAALVLLMVSVHLSWEVGRLEDKSRRLAEDIAILSERVRNTESGPS